MKENIEPGPAHAAVGAREGPIATLENPPLESESEKYMAALWRECIGIPQVSPADKFLDVGGNSLTLNVILHRVETEKGVTLDPVIFFEPSQSSLRQIAAELQRLSAA